MINTKICKTQCGNYTVKGLTYKICVYYNFINVDLILDYKKNKTNSTQL